MIGRAGAGDELTFDLGAMPMSLMWHERTDADADQRHFRKVLVEAVKRRR